MHSDSATKSGLPVRCQRHIKRTTSVGLFNPEHIKGVIIQMEKKVTAEKTSFRLPSLPDLFHPRTISFPKANICTDVLNNNMQ